MLEVILNSVKKKIIDRQKIKFTCWRKYSPEKLREMIKDIEWKASNSTNEIAENTCENLKKILDVLVVKREKQIRHINNKWFTPKVASMKKLVKNARDKFTITNEQNDKLEINRLLREYKEAISDAKSEHVRSQLEKCQKDSKKLWKILKSMYGDKSSNAKSIEYDDATIYDDLENASRLNRHFAESISSIVRNIDTPLNSHYNDLIPFYSSLFNLSELSLNDLTRIVKDLKSKTFDDNISGRVLNDAIEDSKFAQQLLAMVNSSIRESTMPDELKTSVVTPIPKIPSPKTPEDFRPVNNMPVIEKIIECAVYEQLIDYLNENNILSGFQSGFRKQHSTETSIQSVLHDLFEGIHADKKTVAVFLDLRRAFETVNREVLLEKLRRYGFSDQTIAWFKSFLSNRRQRVKFNGFFSDPIDVIHGVPQGSNLSNLLFILFINDLPLILKNAKINMYADDCMVYISSKCPTEAAKRLNEDLAVVADWLRFNGMSLNPRKCSTMFFGMKSSETVPAVYIGSDEIERSSCTKYLGVYIDEKLNFKCHHEIVTAKINKRLALLRRLSHKMTYESKIIFLKSIILPVIDYCSSIFLHFTDTETKSIQRLINKAMRVVLTLPSDSNVEQMHEKLNLMTVNQRVNFNALRIINNAVTRGIPQIFSSKFKSRGHVRQRTLRSDNNIDVPAWRKDSIFNNSVKIYNEIMKNCKNDENIIVKFKKHVKDNC
jgi:hypothetical protein